MPRGPRPRRPVFARPDAGGVTRRHHGAAAPSVAVLASREANALGTRLIISKLFEANRERLKAILDRTLDLIEDAFEARGLRLW